MEDIDKRIADLYPNLLKRAKFLYPRSLDNAQDLAQDTILRMYDNKDSFTEDKNLIGWGNVIMKNIFFNDYRRRFVVGINVLDGEGNADGVFDYLELYAPDASENSKVLDIEDAIESLPELKRTLMNYLLAGYSYEEMSKIMDIPMGSVKSQIHWARNILQKRLTR